MPWNNLYIHIQTVRHGICASVRFTQEKKTKYWIECFSFGLVQNDVWCMHRADYFLLAKYAGIGN